MKSSAYCRDEYPKILTTVHNLLVREVIFLQQSDTGGEFFQWGVLNHNGQSMVWGGGYYNIMFAQTEGRRGCGKWAGCKGCGGAREVSRTNTSNCDELVPGIDWETKAEL